MSDKSKWRVHHPAAEMYAREHKQGQLSRREFLARATSLGIGATAAYGLIGLHAPAVRADGHGKMKGGTIRVQMSVRELKDTRTYDWSELGNETRGNLEYLVEYNNDGSFRPMLLDSWQINDDATVYTLNVRKGVKWDNGDPLTAQHIAFNIERWCEKDAEGNSMAGRMGTLIDESTQRVKAGVIKVMDDYTLMLELPDPDISLIAGFSDYPAAIVHPSYNPSDTMNAIGTGPYKLVQLDVGVKAVLERKPNHDWWGTAVYGGPHLDRIEYIDYGTEPSGWLAAFESEEIDMVHESVGEFIDVFDGLDLKKSEIVTMGTIVIRPNQLAEVEGRRPYADKRVRQALQMAVDNSVLLELGYGNRGSVAENHHIGPIHPEYAPLPKQVVDKKKAMELMQEAGMAGFEHEIMSIDDDWRRNTTDAAAAQLREAGFKVKRTVLPGSTFWNDWTKYPFSSTNWNGRPLGVQIWALAYRSGEAWNEFGWSNAEFDSLLKDALSIADADKRREIAAKGEALIQDEGVTIQPYWRSLYRHTTDKVVDAPMHVSFEHHHYKWGVTS
ncbi:ABC transporter substrate-binding protein [Thioalkalivibrio sp. HK1]|uniref:ABC transporter substrate-binding protein n=1 Tax=Thioalkalivibrio sp. HK1 TaxID=1469245 RepID=UPI00046EED9F|nr:ABC transporter substrate-binding protein [Thioalkalivibrio sp. HK1]